MNACLVYKHQAILPMSGTQRTVLKVKIYIVLTQNSTDVSLTASLLPCVTPIPICLLAESQASIWQSPDGDRRKKA